MKLPRGCHWKVIGEAPPKLGRRRVRCRCVCGREREVYESALRAGRSRSCGCRNGANLTGKAYGHLLALNPVKRADGIKVWLCRCACGKETLVRAQSLKSGHTTSCGCGGGKETPAERPCRYCGCSATIEECAICSHVLQAVAPKVLMEWIEKIRESSGG